jgi:hypothetical protein
MLPTSIKTCDNETASSQNLCHWNGKTCSGRSVNEKETKLLVLTGLPIPTKLTTTINPAATPGISCALAALSTSRWFQEAIKEEDLASEVRALEADRVLSTRDSRRRRSKFVFRSKN